MSTQITKNNSISFSEYIYNILENKTSTFATGWGFFVSIEDNNNDTTCDTKNIKITNTYKSSVKPRSLETIRENSIKSFPSVSNLLKQDCQECKYDINIDDISETMFDMDMDMDMDMDIETSNSYSSSKDSTTDSYKKDLVSNNYYYGYNLASKLYTQITNNIYFLGVVILYGGVTCIKSAIA
jgi:hypothetical protein